MGKLTHLERNIARAKTKLILRHKSKGSYEDFGQKEVGILRNTFTTTDNHFDNMANHKEIMIFSDWCSSYNG